MMKDEAMSKRISVKERVLRLAKNKFLRHGFYKVSMDHLVKELRTSKSSLYNHFDSKEALVKAVIDQLNAEINQQLEKILDDDKLTFKGKLITISAFTKKLLTEVSEEFLHDLEVNTPDIWDYYQHARKQRINKYYKRLFEMGIRAGVVRSDINLELILSVYLSLTEIPLRVEHTDQLEMDPAKIYEDITEIFLNGIIARD